MTITEENAWKRKIELEYRKAIKKKGFTMEKYEKQLVKLEVPEEMITAERLMCMVPQKIRTARISRAISTYTFKKDTGLNISRIENLFSARYIGIGTFAAIIMYLNADPAEIFGK